MTGRGSRMLAVLLAAAAFAYGWQVTRIDLGELVTKAHLVRPLVRDLLRPEVLQRVPRVQEVSVPVALGGPPPPMPPLRGPRVDASSRSVHVGQEVELLGQGFAPGRPGRLLWRDATGAPLRLQEFSTARAGSLRLRTGSRHQRPKAQQQPGPEQQRALLPPPPGPDLVNEGRGAGGALGHVTQREVVAHQRDQQDGGRHAGKGKRGQNEGAPQAGPPRTAGHCPRPGEPESGPGAEDRAPESQLAEIGRVQGPFNPLCRTLP